MNAKTYYFSSPTFGWMPELEITPRVGSNAQRHQPSQSTYQRFVALANSGQYSVAISDREGVAWELRRKAAKPARISPDDWKANDRRDYEALAAYYDGTITGN